MKWISVEDRLPTNSDSVFIWPQVDCDEVEDRFTGQYHSSKFKRENTEVDDAWLKEAYKNMAHQAGWYVETTDGYRSYMEFIKVTHWMPLPEPPTTRR